MTEYHAGMVLRSRSRDDYTYTLQGRVMVGADWYWVAEASSGLVFAKSEQWLEVNFKEDNFDQKLGLGQLWLADSSEGGIEVFVVKLVTPHVGNRLWHVEKGTWSSHDSWVGMGYSNFRRATKPNGENL